MKNSFQRMIRGVFCYTIILFSISSIYAQSASGRVKDSNGEPLIGASVLVKSTTNGTVTDEFGDFTLNDVGSNTVLVISYVGYIPLEVNAGEDLEIVMEAGNSIKEIVVTSENRSVSAQRVPITLELVTGKSLQKNGISDLLQLQSMAPGLNMVQNTIFNQINIRGVGSNDGAAELSDQAVTVGIDGEYINRPVALNTALFDLDRVEVLKGPQGTLYGRNATAGAVNIIAKKPVINRTEIDASLSYGNYNSLKLNGAVNFPLGKKAAFRVAGILSQHDGYRESGISNAAGAYKGDFDNGKFYATRAGLTFNPTKALSVYLAGELSKVDQQAPAQYGKPMTAETSLKGLAPTNYNTDLPKNFDVATVGFMEVDQNALRGKIAYDFGGAKLTYTGGIRKVDMLGYQPLNGFLPETFSFHNDLNYNTQSHELRINGESEKFVWQGGYYYGNEDQNVDRGLVLVAVKGIFGGQAPFLNFFIRDINSKTSGLFGQGTYNFNEKFSFTGGLRYTSDSKSRTGGDLAAGPMPPNASVTRFFYPTVPTSNTQTGMRDLALNTSLPNSGKWSQVTYLLNLEYKPDANKLLFLKHSTGYKAGGFDNIGNYKAEHLSAVELGSKNKLFNNRYKLNASLFNYNYKDQQVTVFISTAVGGAIMNAGKSKVSGLELDNEFQASKSDRLRLTINYLDAKFKDLPTTRNRVGASSEVVNLKGNRPVQAPKWTMVGGYGHDFKVGNSMLSFDITSMFKSEYYITPFNFNMDKQKAYTKTDVNLTYTAKGGKWDFGVFAQNLEDNRILTFASFTGGGIDIYNWIFGTPRLFGAQIHYNFRKD